MHASLQAGAFNTAPQFNAAVPAEPAAPAPSELPAPTEPADAGDISGGCRLTARQQRQKVPDPLFASTTIQLCPVQAVCTVTVQVLVMLLSRQQAAACLSYCHLPMNNLL